MALRLDNVEINTSKDWVLIQRLRGGIRLNYCTYFLRNCKEPANGPELMALSLDHVPSKLRAPKPVGLLQITDWRTVAGLAPPYSTPYRTAKLESKNGPNSPSRFAGTSSNSFSSAVNSSASPSSSRRSRHRVTAPSTLLPSERRADHPAEKF